MLNHITIMGRLTRDPELRRTQSGKAVASFSVACERDFKNQDGTRETDFIDCVCFGKLADAVANYFSKGRMAVVSGRLQMRDWNDKDGNKRRTAEIVAENVYFCGSRRDGTDNNVGSTAPSSYAPQGAQSYGGGSNYAPGNFSGYNTPTGFEQLEDDDSEVRLPF